MSGTIQRRSVNELCHKVRTAVAKGARRVILRIDSPGGCVYSTLRAVDCLSNLGVPVDTIGVGRIFSAAVTLWACGERRFLAPSATVMVHSVSSAVEGSVHALASDTKETQRLQRRMAGILSRSSKHSRPFFLRMLRRNVDVYLTPKKCRQLGLATSIGVPQVSCEIKVCCMVGGMRVHCT